jgi:hypothetical protein
MPAALLRACATSPTGTAAALQYGCWRESQLQCSRESLPAFMSVAPDAVQRNVIVGSAAHLQYLVVRRWTSRWWLMKHDAKQVRFMTLLAISYGTSVKSRLETWQASSQAPYVVPGGDRVIPPQLC